LPLLFKLLALITHATLDNCVGSASRTCHQNVFQSSSSSCPVSGAYSELLHEYKLSLSFAGWSEKALFRPRESHIKEVQRVSRSAGIPCSKQVDMAGHQWPVLQDRSGHDLVGVYL